MESLLICSSSNFHPPSSSKTINIINVKRPVITAKLLFNTFHPIKKINKILMILNNNNSSSRNKKGTSSLVVDNILSTLDDLISAFLDLPLHSGNDPKQVLSGNYEPVGEQPPTACPVVFGSLPSCLDGGAYIRNGPNPRFLPNGPYHLLDGDGMLHMVKISKGEATFCSRYVKTHKYEMESAAGYAVVPNFVACFNGPAASVARMLVTAARVLVARHFDPAGHGFGVANTGVALLAGRLFAVCESDLPYEIKVTEDGDIVTLGRHDFQSAEPSFVRMTAHPRVDLETGDVFAFRYNPTRPFLTFPRIDREGRKQKDVPIFSVKECTVVHDFGITENNAIFLDTQLVINPAWVLRGPRGSPVGVDFGKTPRLGIIPRYAEDGGEMRWIDAPGLNILHVANAWEEDGGDTIVMVATNCLKVEHFIGNLEWSELTLEKVTIDVKAKRVKRRPLTSGRYHELATINPAYANKKNRYVYAAVLEGRDFVGVEKLDLSVTGDDCTVARRMYGAGSYSGESIFVANDPEAGEEDDGYLITYVHDKNTQESKFLVMDAKSPDLDIVAAVKMPQRIPTGFHGLFVSEGDLNKL